MIYETIYLSSLSFWKYIWVKLIDVCGGGLYLSLITSIANIFYALKIWYITEIVFLQFMNLDALKS